MHKLLKMIPTTPDMVSLWLPSGQNRAQDIIRGNHGQCFGTHPNVPVLPNVINPSLGWVFDGVDDYVNCGNDKSLEINPTIKQWTMGAWINPSWFEDPLTDSATVLWRNDGYGIRLEGPDVIKVLIKDTVGWKIVSKTGYSTDNYYFITGVLNGSRLSLCVNGTEVASRNDVGIPDVPDTNLFIGQQSANTRWFKGFITLPFIANGAWSVAKVNNFYLATRDFFQPRG